MGQRETTMKHFLFSLAILCLASSIMHAQDTQLLFENSDFENGNLKNWTAEGEAFLHQPTKGDNIKARGRGYSKHQGQYWIGTFEDHDGIHGTPGQAKGDISVGRLTSIPFMLQQKFMTFRIGGGAASKQLSVGLICEGKEISLATGTRTEAMALVSVDVSRYMGKTVQIKIVDHATGHWGHLNVDDFRGGSMELGVTPGSGLQTFPTYLATNYDQTYRPQFHFTSRMNWLNDPNGLCYHDGQYHLFFQHNPMGNDWGNMSWGHATSEDMVHWKQIEHALLPYDGATIFSGTGFVDHNDSLMPPGQDGKKKLVLCYTKAKRPFGQCIAYSTDRGRTFQQVNDGNPVVPNHSFDPGERDPKVFWHEESQKWVMVLWVKRGKPGKARIFNSYNLVDWSFSSDVDRDWLFECIDLVELPIDGDHNNKKWVLYDASFEYEIGDFDGESFTSDKKILYGDLGQHFYAGQSFNNSPDERTVMMAWMRGSNFQQVHMPFNQQMTFPTTMELKTTPQGLRLVRWPIKEIESLYDQSHSYEQLKLSSAAKHLSELHMETFDLSISFEAKALLFDLRGLKISYDPELKVFKTPFGQLPAPSINGAVSLRVLMDRASVEMFANGGLSVSTSFLLFQPDNRSLQLTGDDGITIRSLRIHSLKSSWR
jgi:fructan beta-fructosidase